MVSWERTDGGIRLVWRGHPPVEIRTRQFTPAASGPALRRPAQRVLSARASALKFEANRATICRADGTVHREWDGQELALPPGPNEIRLGGTPSIVCRVNTGVRVRPDGRRRIHLDFHAHSPVTLGASLAPQPQQSVVEAPRTIEGVVAAMTRINASMDPSHPDRSWPRLRSRPPGIHLSDDAHVPSTPPFSHDLTLEIPRDIGIALVCAPLAYYLGVPVQLASNDSVKLIDHSTTWSHTLPTLPRLEAAVAKLLQRCVLLDSHVRQAGRFSAPDAATDRLREWGLHGAGVFTDSITHRLRTYLDVSAASIDDASPEWPLAGYLPPTLASACALPFLLDRLAVVGLPHSEALPERELIERSLDAFYRSESPASTELLKPRLQSAKYHVWFGDGVPIDVFTASPDAIARDYSRARQTASERGIAVVINDRELSGFDEITRVSQGNERLPVSVRRDLSSAELRSVFEEPLRLVHFIGHCDGAGLRCRDGHLGLATLDAARSDSFFLNACGSYQQGTVLVEAGCRVGAVTFAPVVDRQAASVGKTFLELLTHGFCFERAMALARRQIMMGKDYAVIGDGTYRLFDTRPSPPTVARAKPRDDGSVEIIIDTTTVGGPGSLISVPDGDTHRVIQRGRQPSLCVPEETFLNVLGQRCDPVIYDGKLQWPSELRAQLVDR